MICPFDTEEDCIHPEDDTVCEECELWEALYHGV